MTIVTVYKSGMLGLGLKTKIFGLGLEARELGLGLATEGSPRARNLGLVARYVIFFKGYL